MKYTIEGFSQKYAMTLKKEVDTGKKIITKKIDCTDLVILRWFVDFYPNMKKIEVDGVQYAWLTHKKLLEDLPIVDINKRSFIDRMQKLVDFNILSYKLLKEGGTFSLYGFGENYKYMIESFENAEGMQSNNIGSEIKQSQGMQSNGIGVCNQTDNKDKSIKDTSIINSSNKKESKKGSFDDLINSFTENEEERELLGEWLKVRKAKRAAMTNRAIELNLNKLRELASKSNMSIKEYLQEVICRGWAAFFEIKNYNQQPNKQPEKPVQFSKHVKVL